MVVKEDGGELVLCDEGFHAGDGQQREEGAPPDGGPLSLGPSAGPMTVEEGSHLGIFHRSECSRRYEASAVPR